MKKIAAEELQKIIKREMEKAVGKANETLSTARTALKAAYLGESANPGGDTKRRENGWSTYIDRSVMETIEWAKPSLLRVFSSTDEIIRFEPRNPDQEQFAEDATDYINYVVFGQSAFQVVHDVICDSLYQRVGWLKVWWDKREIVTVNELEGLSEEEALAAVMTAGDPKGVEVTAEKGSGPDEPTLYSLVIRAREDRSGIKIACLSSERVIWSEEALNIVEARFVAHWEEKSKAELIEEGYPRDLVMGLKNDGADDYPEEQVQRALKSNDQGDDGDLSGPAARLRVYEAWLRVDTEKGMERHKVVYVGRQSPTILSAEEWSMDRPPLFPVSSVPLPHDVAGLCLADLVIDVQRLRTEISRQMLDGLALGNMGELVARHLNKSAEIDDDQFLRRRPGGVYHVFGEADLTPLPVVSTVAADAAAAMSMTDKLKESRTGIGQQLQGLSADALQNTATGANILEEAINQRIEMIARVLAEGLFKPAGGYALRLVTKHQSGRMSIRLKGKFRQMVPQSWDPSMEVQVSVGLGTGNQGRQVAGLQAILALQEKIAGALQLQSPVKIVNVIKAAHKLAQALGFRSPEQFFGTIEDAQKADEAMAGQDREDQNPEDKLIQLEMAKSQAQAQAKQQETQARIALDREKAQADMELQREEAQARIALEEAKMAADYRLREQQIKAEAELDAVKMAMGQTGPGVGLVPEAQL